MDGTKLLLLAVVVCLFASPVFASYTCTVKTYQSVPSLHGSDTVLFTRQGGTNTLDLYDLSYANIEGTSQLKQGAGGIFQLNLFNSSSLDICGGEVGLLYLNNNATAVLTGGEIWSIASYQIVLDNPHIKLYYSGDLPTVQTISGYDYLTGTWHNGTSFEILLLDTGYDVLGNIEFVHNPEPATLFLLGTGGLLLRRKIEN